MTTLPYRRPDPLKGYFLVSRGLFDHKLFASNDPLSRLEAWLWLIEHANFAPGSHRQGSSVYEVPRGDFAGSYRSLAAKWKWSPNRVIRELNLWKNQSMIDLKTEHGYVAITICNYEKYQSPLNTDGTLAEQQRNTRGTATDTNQKKEKKEKKENNDSACELLPPSYVNLATWDAYREMRRGIKKPLSSNAERLAIKSLEQLHDQGYDVNAALEYSILNSYSGIYPPKGGGHGRQTQLFNEPKSKVQLAAESIARARAQRERGGEGTA